MSALLGVSGANRNACVSIYLDGQIRAACEQERLTRCRGAGVAARALPVEAIDKVLEMSKCRHQNVTAYVVAEPEMRMPAGLRTVAIDHHLAHAATAFLTSPFQRAAVLICDGHSDRELSVWLGDGTRLEDQHWQWRGPAFATLYSDCASLFECGRDGGAHSLEMLAHLGRGHAAEQLRDVFRCADGVLEIESDWREHIDRMIQSEQRGGRKPVEAASAVQSRIGELLLELVADIRATLDIDTLCLGGGLFFNTYFNTLLRTSGVFKETFVPINPGNAGLAVGAALLVGCQSDGATRPAHVSPFLGPEYDLEEVKAALDGCKLSYDFVSEHEAVEATVAGLRSGQLVGWFQGRMEWGHRALGHRTILADPHSPYVLDNLNLFLRKRERSRPFGVSACAERVPDLFCGPPSSPFMEYQYRLRDDRFRHLMPGGATSIRVQTVTDDMGQFHRLLRRTEETTGAGVLVNTSFNGFHEPIVCTPADAIRAFYGTGLDMLVMERFILRK